MQVIQLLTTISYGDAVGNDVLAMDAALKNAGYDTCIFAENIGKRIPPGVARHISKVPKLRNEDIIIYHLSTGTDLNYRLPEYGGQKVIVYHNITPYRYFSAYSRTAWQLCREGLKGTRFLADKADYCLADSEYNKEDLLGLGYNCRIDVLPILIPFDDYKKEPNKKTIEKYAGDGFTNIIFTGRIAPNKCQEDIIAAFYQYHINYDQRSRLILVGNYEGMESYYQRLLQYSEKLGIKDSVIFTGHVSFDEILAYYRVADMFLCMSEHEGFCVPLVEAMFFDIPIVAFDSSAIADTLGGSGFLLKEKNPLETAGAIDYILKNNAVKEAILHNEKDRLKDFAHERVEKQFLSYIEQLRKGY